VPNQTTLPNLKPEPLEMRTPESRTIPVDERVQVFPALFDVRSRTVSPIPAPRHQRLWLDVLPTTSIRIFRAGSVALVQELSLLEIVWSELGSDAFPVKVIAVPLVSPRIANAESGTLPASSQLLPPSVVRKTLPAGEHVHAERSSAISML
jgi:hypothetical protein